MRLYIVALLCIASLIVKGQLCGSDSVVLTRQVIDATVYLTTDSFNLITGVQTSYKTSNSGSGIPSITQTNFDRRFFSLTTDHDSSQFILREGTGTGFVNKTRIDFTYDPVTNQILSRLEYTGAGLTWTLVSNETWTYNSNHLILNYSGPLIQKLYSYTNDRSDSVVFKTYDGTSFVNDHKFSFTYNSSGFRDSIYIQQWNDITQTWNDSIASQYDASNNYRASVSHVSLTGNPPSISDTTYIELDTLNNIVKRYYTDFNNIIEDIDYIYVHSHLLPSYTLTSYYGCYNEGTNHYDAWGILTGYDGSSECFHPHEGGWSNTYDSLYRYVSASSYDYSGGGDVYFETNFFYPDYTHIIYSVSAPDLISNNICQGDSLHLTSLIGGGCGPYHFHWTPSTGLSSDTIQNPLILIDTLITYNITVTDTSGHSTTSQLSIIPTIYVHIDFDSTLCSGCPVTLHATANQNGAYQWYIDNNLIAGATSDSLLAADPGEYYVRFSTNSYNSCIAQSHPVSLNLTGLSRISGRIFLDVDTDCIFSSADHPLSYYGTAPYLVKIEKQNYVTYAIPDSSGIFNTSVDTGNYSISLINPSSLTNINCPASGILNATVSTYGDTINGNDFALKSTANCSRMRVNVSSTKFHPCEPVNVFINYFNEGNEDEDSVIINVKFPNELSVTSSQIPYTILPGNIFQFQPISLTAGNSGTLIVTANVECDPVNLLNATLCIDAEISPVDFCSLQPVSTWDGSSIRVSPVCNNDSSCFEIKNVSQFPMDTSSQWRLYADNILIKQGTFILPGNSDTSLCFISEGKTLRLEADENAGFPIHNSPRASLERCGALLSNGSYSTGQILQQSLNNVLPFYYTSCGIVTASHSANTKSIQPEGLTYNHIVGINDLLTYRIDFQNTGTDTAFNVVINDVIDTTILDISTINLLPFSHQFTFQILRGNVLNWTNNNLLLPDSGTNNLASSGFVLFTIKPKTSVINGMVITNRANINYDHNRSVNTNLVVNTICDIQPPISTVRLINSYCNGNPARFFVDITGGGSLPNIHWYVNNNLITGNYNDTLSISTLNYGDTVYCDVISNFNCASPGPFISNKLIFEESPVPQINFASPFLTTSPGISYQWYYNQHPVPYSNQQSIYPAGNGMYYVEIHDSAGCILTSAEYNFTETSINLNKDSKPYVYPNPADEYILIKNIIEKSDITLTDLTGKIISGMKSDRREKNTVEIFVKDIKPGIYLLRIMSANNYYNYPVRILHQD